MSDIGVRFIRYVLLEFGWPKTWFASVGSRVALWVGHSIHGECEPSKAEEPRVSFKPSLLKIPTTYSHD